HSAFSSFANNPTTTRVSTLSLHDALPISRPPKFAKHLHILRAETGSFMSETDYVTAKTVLLVEDDDVVRELTTEVLGELGYRVQDRKSTRLNSSHVKISYAVFCLKKKIEK